MSEKKCIGISLDALEIKSYNILKMYCFVSCMSYLLVHDNFQSGINN